MSNFNFNQANEPKVQLLNGDCFELMREIPDGSVDLILTDPPYNLANYSTGNLNFSWRSEINNDLAEWDRKTLKPEMLIKDFKRILKPTGNIFIFCSYNLIGEYHKVFDPEFDTFQFMVWHKTNPTPNIRKSSFLNSCELIICCWNKGHVWNFTRQNEMHNFIETPICMGRERIKNPKHPTQKPVKVLEHIINIASNPGGTVCDMFSGVGSTGEAAVNLGRNFIGIEYEPEYFKAGQERILNNLKNLKLNF
ncbi:MAG: site-specific DNA-methyltransferase [Synergistaceae bacterium]|nr:site-specific DNA-methyltransferase [Synergistaceae bacterium]MBQ6740098.1 site-specific DNA-methyltransferase [Synergistaceae bacterium]MBQ6909361.1 site-specific DNA-methyltransferase [Synergistaceae bacterium]MBQ7569570.1 site-specific DNA-methyltransferase [Synergistaceae bacterium]MBQ9581008.1 site-specific DNA-methyltransferase [Synergistaceae bacterium]